MSFDFKNMTEAQLYALLGIKKKTPEEWEEYYRQERERIQKEQSYLARLYETGEYLIYRRTCPSCGTIFYTTNERRKYDDYYQCSRYIHRANAKERRAKKRESTICKTCGAKFSPSRAGAQYCCNACRQKAYRQRVTDKACGHSDHLS